MTSRRLSENFTVTEFECKHCRVCRVEPSFIKLLQQLRDEISRPLIVTSGYRCAAHPVERAKAPGSFSAHMYGIAADVTCPTLDLELLYKAALKIPGFKGIGAAPWQNYLHLDARSKVTRWAYDRMARTVYWDGKWESLSKPAANV